MEADGRDIDVLIVGAGPTGLTLALALKRMGVSSVVIDRQEEGANTSRAAVVHARTLEVMRDLGIVDDLLARGVKVPTFRLRDRDRVLLTVDFSRLETTYPFTLMIPQSETEAIICRHLQQAGGRVDRPVEMISMQLSDSGADVILRDGERQRSVRVQWVVGCDGGRSTVRSQAGIDFVGGDYDEAFILADVMMDWPLSRSEVGLFLSQHGLVVVAPLPDEQFRIVATVSREPAMIDAVFLDDLLTSRGPTPAAAVREVVWSSSFHLRHRVAETPFKGRVLLCGDAAHVHSPAGGQGMNTGVQDAASLAPALAAALAGAPADALQAWADRRHVVARDVVALTNRMTRLATMRSPFKRSLRNTILPVMGFLPGVKEGLARRLAELDYK